MQFLDQLLAWRGGVYCLLMVAAILEVWGDSFFYSAVRSSGLRQWISALAGAAILASYGLFVNLPKRDFGPLLGLYVVFFFVVAQAMALLKFRQPPTLPVCVGGVLIVAGGLVINCWKG